MPYTFRSPLYIMWTTKKQEHARIYFFQTPCPVLSLCPQCFCAAGRWEVKGHQLGRQRPLVVIYRCSVYFHLIFTVVVTPTVVNWFSSLSTMHSIVVQKYMYSFGIGLTGNRKSSMFVKVLTQSSSPRKSCLGMSWKFRKSHLSICVVFLFWISLKIIC